MKNKVTRRSFLRSAGIGAVALGLSQVSCSVSRKTSAQEVNVPPVQGFERVADTSEVYNGWKPITERKVRVGIAGYGVCKFGADFGFQNHPNVEIVAVTDLFPDRCAELAKASLATVARSAGGSGCEFASQGEDPGDDEFDVGKSARHPAGGDATGIARQPVGSHYGGIGAVL